MSKVSKVRGREGGREGKKGREGGREGYKHENGGM